MSANAAFRPICPWSGIGLAQRFAQQFAALFLAVEEHVFLAANVAPYIGIMTALYALMQFIFAPVLCPLVFSSIYFGVRAYWPGAVWLSVIVVYAALVPLVLGLRLPKPAQALAG